MDLPRRRVLTGAALLVVAAVVVIGVAHSVAGPPPVPPAVTAAPAPVVETAVHCDLGMGAELLVTLPPGAAAAPVSLYIAELIPGSDFAQRSLGDFVWAVSTTQATTARFRLTRRSGTAFVQGKTGHERDVPYDCPLSPRGPPSRPR